MLTQMHLGSQAFLQCSSYDIGVASVVLAAEMLGLPYLFEEEDLSYILEGRVRDTIQRFKKPCHEQILPLNPQ